MLCVWDEIRQVSKGTLFWTVQVDVSKEDVLGHNSLQLAAQAGALNAVRLLVKNYFLDINSINIWGQTALHLTAKASIIMEPFLSLHTLYGGKWYENKQSARYV